MKYDIVIPSTADGALQVTLVAWLCKAGDPVKQGSDMAEATTEKITLYITAPADGVLSEILVEAGTRIDVGGVIGVLQGA